MKIIDNFLEEDYFNKIEKILLSNQFPYFYGSTLNHNQKNNKDYTFAHVLYDFHQPQSSFFNDFYYLLEKIHLEDSIKSLIRMKVNFYPNSPSIVEHAKHVDLTFQHKGFILYINSCDGYTVLENGDRVESIRNRALFFDSSKPHASTTCTNVHGRININMNYF
jgi:hypothetical protein